MTDKMVDVGGRCRPGRPTSAADIFGSSFPTFTPTSSSDVGPTGRHSGECRPPTLSVQFSDTQADVCHRRWPECRKIGPTMSAADTRQHSGQHSVCYPSVWAHTISRTNKSNVYVSRCLAVLTSWPFLLFCDISFTEVFALCNMNSREGGL